MAKIILWFCIVLFATLFIGFEPAIAAKKEKTELVTPAVLVCFSGGKEIVRKTIVDGPFADEYKFAHEVKVADETGEHNLNFSGGLCIIDRGVAKVKQQLNLSDKLSCYSGANLVVVFEIYGRESTVDEYLEGRTFLAKTSGNSFNSDVLHQYLVFGGGACLGEEIN